EAAPRPEADPWRHDLATSVAQGPSIALGYIKRNINNAETMSLEACFDGEAIHHSRAGESARHKEAANDFVEKREPAFQGHCPWRPTCGCGRSVWSRRISSRRYPI